MRGAAVVALAMALGWAPHARAQGNGNDLEQSCLALLRGEATAGQQDVSALRAQCEQLLRARVDEQEAQRQAREASQKATQLQQEVQQEQAQQRQAQQQARVEPGQAQQAPQPGPGVLAAFGQAGRELIGRAPSPGLGRRGNGGYFVNTLSTNAFGWFTGLGVNAEYSRALEAAPKFSWVAGARYSRTSATNGDATAFGAMGGADWYIIGRNNEGLRIGPRIELAIGSEDFQGQTTFARLGLSGELGYNFIASNGITAQLAGGLGFRVAGDKNDNFSGFTGGELGPYLKIGVGYSW